MTRCRFALRPLLAILLLLALPARAEIEIAPGEIKLEVIAEARDHPVLAEEMILITIRGSYRIPITLENLVQPDLQGFDWMQLGEDHWFNTVEDGLTVVNLERRMALFPQEPGEIEIGAFVHELNLLSPSGQRFEHAESSAPLTLTVEPRPEADWWFPVRTIEITDNWSNAPERLKPGEGALRIVTVAAHGVEPELMPPMPEMTGAGAHIFPHPEHRIVTLGPHGPITRAFWRWTIRPQDGTAGFLDPIRVSYFDTQTREEKEITLSAQRVAYLGTGAAAPQTAPPGPETGAPLTADRPGEDPGWPRWSLPAAFAAGLTLSLAALAATGPLALGLSVGRLRRWMARAATRHRLRRAIARGEIDTAWRAVRSLGLPASPARSRLERALFGNPDTTAKTAPDLKDLLQP